MVKINQKFITKRNNTRPGWKQVGIRGIVVHYTANPGAGADNHYRYFNNGAGGRSASAHYFVDAKEVIQIIPDDEVAFHVNEGKTRKLSWMNASIPGYVGNGNVCSIGIEMCQERDGSFHPNTVKQTQQLIAMLMKKYNIGISRVVRHYDQTGKFCPGPYVSSTAAWNNFKAGIDKNAPPVSAKPTTPPVSTGGGSSVTQRSHIGIATVKAASLNLRNKPNLTDSKVIKSLGKGSSWKVYGITPDGWVDLGGGYVSNKNNAYVDIKLLWD